MSGNLSQTNFAIQGSASAISVSAVLAGIQLPSASQSWKYAQGACNGASKTAATVTAGKTAYVIAVTVDGSANDAVQLETSAGAGILRLRFLANTGLVISNPVPIAVYQAGENIKIEGAATSIYGIVYYEA